LPEFGAYSYEMKGQDEPYLFSFIMAGIALMPAVRQTRASVHSNPRAKKYNDQQGLIRDMVIILMREKGLNPAPAGLKLQAEVHVHRKRTAGDADNFLKAAIDALQGGVYDNDTNIWKMEITKHKQVNWEGFSTVIKEIE